MPAVPLHVADSMQVTFDALPMSSAQVLLPLHVCTQLPAQSTEHEPAAQVQMVSFEQLHVSPVQICGTRAHVQPDCDASMSRRTIRRAGMVPPWRGFGNGWRAGESHARSRSVRCAPMTTFSPIDDASTFRRMAAAMWRAPSAPTIHGAMDVDVTDTLAALQRYRERTGVRLTLTHVVTRAAALAFAKYPHLNARVRFGGRLERRHSVDLFVSVSTDGGRDLSGARLDAVDALSLPELVQAVEGRSRGIRAGQDASFEKSRGLFRALPFWLLKPLLSLVDFLSNELDVHLPAQGMPRDPFGTAVITNLGMFGIDTAFAPFVPLGRCPMLLLITEARPRPWVADGKLEVRQVLRLCGTFDHRIIDGFAAGLLAKEIRHHVEHPFRDEVVASSRAA